jgi:GNAT superfamily N-acetyltransferase
MIRPATEADIPDLVELGRHMHAESPEYRGIRYDVDRVAATLQRLLDGGGIIFVHEADGEIRGGIAGLLGEFWFSSERYASDLALFLHPEHRHGLIAVKLTLAFHAWAGRLGARRVVMGVTTGVNTEKTGQLYRSLGMVDSGNLFKKDFS